MKARRLVLLAAIATPLGVGALALADRRGLVERPEFLLPAGDWESDIPGREASVEPPPLRPRPVLEIADARAGDERPVVRSSAVVFDEDFLWVTTREALLRVARDGVERRLVETEDPIARGTVSVIDDRVVWIEYRYPEQRARVVASPRALDAAATTLGELDGWYVYPAPVSRVIAVGDALAFTFLGYSEPLDEQPPEYALARLPAGGGELRTVKLDSWFCNDYGDITASRGRLALACIQRRPAARVFDVDARTGARRPFRESWRDAPWRPSSAAWTGETMVVTTFDRDSLTIKRLHPDGRLQTILDEPSDGQISGQLVGDGDAAYLYCHGGACGPGRLFWLTDGAWAELPDAPRDAQRVAYTGGVLHWEEWSARGVTLYANTTWPGTPLRGEPDDAAVGGLTRLLE